MFKQKKEEAKSRKNVINNCGMHSLDCESGTDNINEGQSIKLKNAGSSWNDKDSTDISAPKGDRIKEKTWPLTPSGPIPRPPNMPIR
jgi:hypothetical protein